MELLIELLLEFLVEGVFEGAMDGMESKKVPVPLRILCGIVLLAVLVAVAAICILVVKLSESAALKVLMMTVLVGLTVLFICKVVKVVRKRKQ